MLSVRPVELICRFLNIRLDGISVEDPERHPHMVSWKIRMRQWSMSAVDGADGGQELFYKRFGGALCAYGIEERGYDVIGGCYEKG